MSTRSPFPFEDDTRAVEPVDMDAPAPWLESFVSPPSDPCPFPRVHLWPLASEVLGRVAGAARVLLTGGQVDA